MTGEPWPSQSVSNVERVGYIILAQNVGGDVIIKCDRQAPYQLVSWPLAPAPLAGARLSAMMHPPARRGAVHRSRRGTRRA